MTHGHRHDTVSRSTKTKQTHTTGELTRPEPRPPHQRTGPSRTHRAILMHLNHPIPSPKTLKPRISMWSFLLHDTADPQHTHQTVPAPETNSPPAAQYTKAVSPDRDGSGQPRPRGWHRPASDVSSGVGPESEPQNDCRRTTTRWRSRVGRARASMTTESQVERRKVVVMAPAYSAGGESTDRNPGSAYILGKVDLGVVAFRMIGRRTARRLPVEMLQRLRPGMKILTNGMAECSMVVDPLDQNIARARSRLSILEGE